MSKSVEKLDMNVKKYLESQMGFKTVSCNTAGHSVKYKMYHKQNTVKPLNEIRCLKK